MKVFISMLIAILLTGNVFAKDYRLDFDNYITGLEKSLNPGNNIRQRSRVVTDRPRNDF